jgi:hypothetical protein
MTEPVLGCYVYCVVRAGEHPPLDGLHVADADFAVEIVTYGGLSTLMSRVRLEEFGAEALSATWGTFVGRADSSRRRRRACPLDAVYRLDARRAAEFACVPTSSPPVTTNCTSWSPAHGRRTPSPPRSPVRVAGCMTSSRWSTEDAACDPGSW